MEPLLLSLILRIPQIMIKVRLTEGAGKHTACLGGPLQLTVYILEPPRESAPHFREICPLVVSGLLSKKPAAFTGIGYSEHNLSL